MILMAKRSPIPEFLTWKQVDSHLLSCITATLTPVVFTSVLQCSTSYEVWTLLTKRFTSLSRSHIHQLKNKLNVVSKKSLSMEDYLLQVKTISDQLALVSSPIEEEDLILIVLNGLPTEYNALKTAIRARTEPITTLDLSTLLCSEALHVESEIKVSSSLSDLTVAYSATQDQGSKSQYNSGFRGHKYSNYRGGSSTRGGRYVHRGHFNHRGGGRSAFSSHSFSQQPNPTPNSLICQICGKPNHTAIDCWCRMDSSYQASSSSSSAPKPAFIANASTSSPSANWYVYSAATTHVTPDLNNMQQYQPYYGSDHVTVGNGHSIPIQNTGQGQDYSDPSIQRGP